MVNKHARPPAKSDGRGFYQVDGVPIENELLLNLPAQECDSICSALTFVELRTNDVLHEAGEPIKFAYFVNSGLTSVLNVLEGGKSVEVGLTGKEGFVGLPIIVGLRTSPHRVVVQIEGTGFRVGADTLQQEVLRQCPALERRMQRYVQFLAMQGTQVAACNRLHEVDERLARWLLMSQDRIGSDTVPLTQEFLAHMLGTRRASVTVAAGMLHKAGLISYNRGHVKIQDRAHLEQAACECYEVMQRQTKNWQRESE
jgi:CRP-like cAMP-binding protein